MNVNSNLLKAVKELTEVWPHCGTVRILTWEEYVTSEHQQASESYAEFLKSRNIHFQPAPDCIVVDFDLNDEELEDDSERDHFINELENLWNGMAEQGQPLYEHDGSGGGLYYGLSIYPAK